MARKMSGGLEMRLDGGEAFVKQMREASKQIRTEFVGEGREIAREWRQETRSELPRLTGEARRQTRHFARGNRSGVEAGIRSGLVYMPALHYSTRGGYGAAMRKYGRAPRFAFAVRRRRKQEWADRLLELVVQAALTVSSIRRG